MKLQTLVLRCYCRGRINLNLVITHDLQECFYLEGNATPSELPLARTLFDGYQINVVVTQECCHGAIERSHYILIFIVTETDFLGFVGAYA